MKRTVLVMGVVLLLGSSGWAFGQTVVPLAPTELKAEPAAVFWAERFLEPLPGKPTTVTAVPKLTGTACYMTTDLGGSKVVMLLDRASKSKLYVDSDRDGDLAEEQPFDAKPAASGSSGGLLGALTGGSQSSSFSFPFVTLAVKDPPATCEVTITGSYMGSGRAYAYMRPAALRAGRVKLDGVERQVQVMDATLDGRYDNAFGSPGRYAWDALFLDVNGDGKLATSTLTSGEVMALPSIVRVGNAWYSIKVAADGSTATFTPVEPQMGRLDVGSKQVELSVFSDSGYHRLAKSENGWEVPAGRYQVASIRLAETVSGTPWTISSSWPTGKLEGFAVQPNATTAVMAGPPLKSDLSFTGARPLVSIGYSLQGRAGEEYSAGAEKRGISQAAPAFVILSEDEKKLASGMFEYG